MKKNINMAECELKGSGVVTMCFTSQPLDETDENNLPLDNILIVHRGNFNQYYGPFATRAAFSMTRAFNPNFTDMPHLIAAMKGVGEATAQKILKRRAESPFISEEDFFARNPEVKKPKLKAKSLSFFPWESKRLHEK